MIAGLCDLLRAGARLRGRPGGAAQAGARLRRALSRPSSRSASATVWRCSISLAPETLDAMVPNLMLQPLVENAVRHGVARAPFEPRSRSSRSASTTGSRSSSAIPAPGPRPRSPRERGWGCATRASGCPASTAPIRSCAWSPLRAAVPWSPSGSRSVTTPRLPRRRSCMTTERIRTLVVDDEPLAREGLLRPAGRRSGDRGGGRLRHRQGGAVPRAPPAPVAPVPRRADAGDGRLRGPGSAGVQERVPASSSS